MYYAYSPSLSFSCSRRRFGGRLERHPARQGRALRDFRERRAVLSIPRIHPREPHGFAPERAPGIRAQAGTSELSINGVRFFTHFPLLTSGDEDMISVMDVSKIIEPVLRPSRIQHGRKSRRSVLDPGHGGTDQGASSRWGTEKGFALDVALAARRELIRAGYEWK